MDTCWYHEAQSKNVLGATYSVDILQRKHSKMNGQFARRARFIQTGDIHTYKPFFEQFFVGAHLRIKTYGPDINRRRFHVWSRLINPHRNKVIYFFIYKMFLRAIRNVVVLHSNNCGVYLWVAIWLEKESYFFFLICIIIMEKNNNWLLLMVVRCCCCCCHYYYCVMNQTGTRFKIHTMSRSV